MSLVENSRQIFENPRDKVETPELARRLHGANSRDHLAWAAEAVEIFQSHCRTGDDHAIADLICDLGHLAEDRGLDFLSEVRRGVGHWYAEQHSHGGNLLGPDATVEVIIEPK